MKPNKFTREATLHKLLALVFRGCIFNASVFCLNALHIFSLVLSINKLKTNGKICQWSKTEYSYIKDRIYENHILCNTLRSVASQVDLSCTGFNIFLDVTFKQVKNTN